MLADRVRMGSIDDNIEWLYKEGREYARISFINTRASSLARNSDNLYVRTSEYSGDGSPSGLLYFKDVALQKGDLFCMDFKVSKKTFPSTSSNYVKAVSKPYTLTNLFNFGHDKIQDGVRVTICSVFDYDVESFDIVINRDGNNTELWIYNAWIERGGLK